MCALTIRMADEQCQRLKALSWRRRININPLIDEMTTPMLAQFDAEARFVSRAERSALLAERWIALPDLARLAARTRTGARRGR
ncbi:toxin-antitoxin system HicB family antitoxin [Sinimarinibacterium thermocellulolyticum]|uniref:Toxin-antitoxin system HicB family antitoxin n=1 Tax=Sinimarinibacterium thermocellulolyticum TaxID=3170016 RepID=A0ABV2A9T2_9GAMM